MKLDRHLSQGKLLYFSRHYDAISISENSHFRWLAFNDVVQSVMHQRKPHTLTLPHQLILLLPLLLYRPKKIVELGLGGGNLSRFLSALSCEIELTSVEYNPEVITCFSEYFNPCGTHFTIIGAEGLAWLNVQPADDIDWLICDVYRSDESGFQGIVKQLEVLTEKLHSQSCLSINLPDVSDNEINLCLTLLLQLQVSHNIRYFHVPNYLNIVIHLYPKHWPLHRILSRGVQRNNNYLSPRVFNRWCKFWPHGQSIQRVKSD